MSAPAKLAGFGACLAALFGIGTLAGAVTDPPGRGENPAPAGMGEMGGGHEADPVRGLAVAEHGLRLVVENPRFDRGRAQTLRFRVVDGRGRAVRDFDVEHTRRMHLIVARRDLTGFQHLHPRMAADGTWSVRLRLDEPGSYRVFADFSHDEEATTLAADLSVDGTADLLPLPAPASTARSDGGYDVQLTTGRVRPGQEADLRFAISKDGRAIEPQPYLGARGHLVALREGDLAFLHVHPGERGYMAEFPTAGRYRLFLQFKDAGRVQTVAFTLEVR